MEDTRSHDHHPASPDYSEPECLGCGIIMNKNTGAYCALCIPLVEKYNAKLATKKLTK